MSLEELIKRDEQREEQRRKRQKKYYKEWYKKSGRKRDKIKTKAHYLVDRAIKKGLLVRPKKCSKCNNPSLVEGHHDDYDKPLDVIWLCPTCHSMRHPKGGLPHKDKTKYYAK